MTLPALCNSGYVRKHKFRTVVKGYSAGKKAEQLPALKVVKEHSMIVIPFLLGRKLHFKPVIVTGETPGDMPVRRYMESYLIQFMEFAIQKKGVLRSLGRIS